MKIPTILCGLVLTIAVTGCATTREAAPSTDHPAHPMAAEVPMPKASGTLNEAQADAVVPAESPAATVAADPAAPQVYSCAHHPKVMQAEAGDCPYCGMALVPTSSRQTSPVRGLMPPPAEPELDHSGHEGHK